MAYNLTRLENITRPDEIVSAANTASGGIFGIVVMASIYFLVLRIYTSRGMDAIQAHVYASFIGGIFAVIFWALDWLAWQWTVLMVVLLFGGFVISKWFN